MYSNGKIYKLINDDMNLVYYGSTVQPLYKRMYSHKNFTKDNYVCHSSDLFLYGTCKIVLVEEYPCENRQQLLMRERFHIDNNNCVNKNRPIITVEERIEYKKEFSKTPEALKKCQNYKKENQKILSEIRKTKVKCDVCQVEVTKYNLNRHKKSKH